MIFLLIVPCSMKPTSKCSHYIKINKFISTQLQPLPETFGETLQIKRTVHSRFEFEFKSNQEMRICSHNLDTPWTTSV